MPEERGLYPKMRVGEQLAYLATLHGMSDADAAAAATRWAERLGVGERVGDRVEALSLGNQQRVQLAAALVHDPDLLVLDEPFSGLDPVGVDVLSEVLVDVSRRREVPVIFSSHQLELVERICDAVAIIQSGRLLVTGPVDSLREPHWEVRVAGAADGWWQSVPGVARAPGRRLRGRRSAGAAGRGARGRQRRVLRPGQAEPDRALPRGGRMHSAWYLAARRELRERVRSRAFQVSTGVQVLLLVGVVVLNAAVGGDDTKKFDVGVVDPRSAVIAVTAQRAEAVVDAKVTIKHYGTVAMARQGAARREGRRGRREHAHRDAQEPRRDARRSASGRRRCRARGAAAAAGGDGRRQVRRQRQGPRVRRDAAALHRHHHVRLRRRGRSRRGEAVARRRGHPQRDQAAAAPDRQGGRDRDPRGRRSSS